MARSNKEVRVGHASNRVAHTLLAWMIVAMASGCGGRERETDAKPEIIPKPRTIVDATHITDIFTLEKEVIFPDSIFIGHYTYLDVDADGDFLLTDLIGKQAILFDEDGNHKKNLSTESCDPGFPWSPWQARFKPNGNIIVNSSLWGYEFSNDGICIDELSDEFGFPKSMGFDNDGHMYGFYVHGQQDEGYHIKKMDEQGRSIERFGFDDTYFWYTMRKTPIPDVIADADDYIYHAKIFSPLIDKYDKEGNFITQIGKKPEYYRSLQLNDSEFADGNNSLSASSKYLNKFSLTMSLWLLNKNTIMIGFLNTYNKKNNKDQEKSIVLMDLEGNHLVNTDIFTHINFINAKNDFAYSFFDSTNSGKGFEVGPPSLKIYRYLHASQ